MNQAEMRTIKNVVEIMVVIVDLRGRQLSLVNDVLGRQGADIKGFRKRNAMCCVLAEDVKLSLELFFVKMTPLANISVSIVGAENNKGLENERFCAAGGWSENGTVGRHLTPAKDSEA
jgi:hypothetical protein